MQSGAGGPAPRWLSSQSRSEGGNPSFCCGSESFPAAALDTGHLETISCCVRKALVLQFSLSVHANYCPSAKWTKETCLPLVLLLSLYETHSSFHCRSVCNTPRSQCVIKRHKSGDVCVSVWLILPAGKS